MTLTLVDTGAIIAAINKNDPYHEWAKDHFEKLSKPFLTCEPVITESAFLLKRSNHSPRPIYDLIHGDHLKVLCIISNDSEQLEQLQQTYSDTPMSLADACLVRMSEIYADSAVLTIDSDFHVYRRNKNQVIPIIMPS